jgi:hypothetical protein
LCDCGKNKTITISNLLSSKGTRSCGHLKHQPRKSYIQHEHRDLYYKWAGMIQRCYNKNNPSYKDYGGRGVVVCDEWRNDSAKFIEWANKNGYKKGLQLDKDIKGCGMLYSPDSCCFVTRKENCNKRRNNKIYNYNGTHLTLSQISDLCGISYFTLNTRLLKGMNINEAVSKPIRYKPVQKINSH